MGRLIRDRFGKSADPFAEGFVASVEDDAALVRHDVAGSIAHARSLRKAGLLTAPDLKAIVAALKRIAEEHEGGRWSLRVEDEDVHMNVERRLTDLAGEAGAKIHAGRSRNDQVATDIRLWAKEAIDGLLESVRRLRWAILRQATKHDETVLPGYTHLQKAQPVIFAHVLLSFHEMLVRDEGRLADARRRVDVSPLGAAALAGTSLPIDPRRAAKALGFAGVFANSIDAVSDRDFAVEVVFACTLLQVHLSQIAENLLLWSSEEFGYLELPDELCTSSSIMPQKKNADMVELVRAKTGVVAGHLVNLILVLKALPAGYNRDLQETKPPLFDAVAVTSASVEAMRLACKGMVVKKDAMEKAALDPALLATDLAEYLVEKGVPFRDAHQAIARLMKDGEKKGRTLWEMSVEDFRKYSAAFDEDIVGRLTPWESVRRKRSRGGTGPTSVRQRLRHLARHW